MMHDFYNLSQTLQGSIFGAMGARRRQQNVQLPALPPLVQVQGGYAESPAWMLVQAIEFDPAPLTVQTVRRRAIYSSERIIAGLLDLMTAAGWLDRSLDGAYRLTKDGRMMWASLSSRSATPLANLNGELATDVRRLVMLQQRVIDAWLADEARDSWCLQKSRNRAPRMETSALQKINQFSSDFNAYRDDAHMASFAGHEISGIGWEAFSFVHDKQADSAEMLQSQLSYRGYSTAEFVQVLTDLTERGWIKAKRSDPSRYRLTEAGRQVRSSAETATDTYFYAAWRQLSAEDVEQLWQLMNDLHQELTHIITS